MENDIVFIGQYSIQLDEGKSSGWLRVPGITDEIQEELYKLTENGLIIIGKNAEDYLNSLKNGYYYSVESSRYISEESLQNINVAVVKIKTLKLV